MCKRLVFIKEEENVKGKILGLLFVMAMVVVMLSGCGTKEEGDRAIEEKTGDVNGDGK